MAIVVRKSVTSTNVDSFTPDGKMIATGIATTMQNKWAKICSIRFNAHRQGLFTYAKVFIGYGNNSDPQQNAYFDMFGQLSAPQNRDGIAAWMVVLHPCSSNFRATNIELKVIANSNTNYDVWFRCTATSYVVPNVLFFPSSMLRRGEMTGTTSCVVYEPGWVDAAPTGTECQLQIITESKDS